MERKQPEVANAINSNRTAGSPSPGPTHPAHGLPKRKKGKEINKVLLSIKRELRTVPLCKYGDLELTLSASLLAK